MVKVTEIVRLFLQICPAVKTEWEEHCQDWKGEPPAYYIEISIFARYLVDCWEESQTASFAEIFELVEHLIEEGDDDTKGVIIVGLLEDLQNSASWKSFGYRVFEPYLGTKSLAAWRELETLWVGENSLADIIRAETQHL